MTPIDCPLQQTIDTIAAVVMAVTFASLLVLAVKATGGMERTKDEDERG